MTKARRDKSSQFDKILKENVESLFLPLTEKYLGVSIAESEDISLPLQKTLERKPDFAKKVTDKEGLVFILHIEFQTSDERKMIDRMQHYHALLRQKYQLPVRQFVVYLGRPPIRYMRHRLKENEIFSGFTLSDLRSYDYQQLLASEVPEEILLAILANYPQKIAVKVIEQVVQRLREVSNDQLSLQKYIQQLMILSRLRNLEDETDQTINDMPITYDITKDKLYLRGKREGKEEEKERTEKKIEATQKGMIERMLTTDQFTDNQIAEIAGVPLNFVQKVRQSIKR